MFLGVSIIYFLSSLSLLLSNPNLRIIDRKIANIENIIKNKNYNNANYNNANYNKNYFLSDEELDIAKEQLRRLKLYRYGIIIREPLD